MVFVAVVGVMVAGALALTAYPSLRVGSVAQPEQPRAVSQPVHPDAPEQSAPAVGAAAPSRGHRTIVEEPEETPAKSTRNSSVPFRWPPPGMKSDTGSARTETDALGRTLDAPAVASTTSDVSAQGTTLSGCLESTVDGAEFRLTDTDGSDAPKARSWRSGFLKKRSAPVELVEVSDPAGLRKYVGHRMVATGLLEDGKLRVRSLQAAGSSCN